MKLCGREIRVTGRLLRIPSLEADGFMFLDDPVPVLDGLRRSGVHIDLFTFVQKLSEVSLPMEWDNLAVNPVSTFDQWWTQQIGFKAHNKANQAEKKGVTLRGGSFR